MERYRVKTGTGKISAAVLPDIFPVLEPSASVPRCTFTAKQHTCPSFFRKPANHPFTFCLFTEPVPVFRRDEVPYETMLASEKKKSMVLPLTGEFPGEITELVRKAQKDGKITGEIKADQLLLHYSPALAGLTAQWYIGGRNRRMLRRIFR